MKNFIACIALLILTSCVPLMQLGTAIVVSGTAVQSVTNSAAQIHQMRSRHAQPTP